MKKRLISLLLALVMILGMIPATALTASAAGTEITGIEVIGEGYRYDTSLSAYSLVYPDVSLISASGKIEPDECLIASLFTDEAVTQRLRTEPQLGETYYFNIYITHNNALYNITNSKSNIKISGFYNGKVLSTGTSDSGRFRITCSVTFGELTGGVKAIASGVEYDSELGGYAPNFTTLKVVSTEGKELEHIVLDGNYHYYGATAGPLYKNRSYGTFSDKLTTEPQIGETYYSYFLLNSIDGNLHIEEDLVDIHIPGYDVKFIDSYGSDMGFTSLVVYSVTKQIPPAEIYVGGVGMYDGDYLAVGATKTQTTKPSGGYAYYENGKLTLDNYSYKGYGVDKGSSNAIIYASNDIQIELVGSNNLTHKSYWNTACITVKANVSLTGEGTLNLQNATWGIKSNHNISIESGSLNIDSCELGIYSFGRKVIINGGNFEVNAIDCAVDGSHGVEINGGSGLFRNMEEGVYSVLHSLDGTVTINPSLIVMASTTAYGELVEYVAENHDSYEKIVITPAPAVTVPAKPHNIVNVVSGVHVYWKTTAGAVKYGLWRSETGKNGTYKWIANPTVPHFTDTKVESGKTYYYKVTSMDAAGNHSEMSEAIGVIYVGTPDITSRFNKAAGITVGWNKIQGATGYAIYRKSYSGTDAWVRVGTVSGNSTFTWQDTEVKNNNGTVYRYTVRALAGSDMKTLSGCRNTGRTMARLTSRVLNSAVKASATSIKCSWTTSSVVTGYEVRFMVGSTVYKTFTVGDYKIGVKTFTGLKAGQTYKIQVRSYVKIDGMGFYAAWSEAKNVKL